MDVLIYSITFSAYIHAYAGEQKILTSMLNPENTGLLEKKPENYTLKDKILIIDSLQAIFNCHEVSENISKSDLVTICDILARIAYVEMDKPNSLETVEYELTKMIAIASFLQLIDDKKKLKLISE